MLFLVSGCPSRPPDAEALAASINAARRGFARMRSSRSMNLIAPTAFKGTMSPVAAARHLAAPGDRLLPLSDGGDGFLECLHHGLGGAIENVPAKAFKEADVWIKTKTPVLMLRTDNEIPKE